MAKQATPGIALSCRALASQRDGTVAGGHVSGRQVGTAVKILAVVTRVTVLAQHGGPRRQQRHLVRAVRRVAVRAVVDNRRMLPQKGTALFRMARVAGLVNRVLHH